VNGYFDGQGYKISPFGKKGTKKTGKILLEIFPVKCILD